MNHTFVYQLHIDGLPTAVRGLTQKHFNATNEAIRGEIGEEHDGALSRFDGDFDQRRCRGRARRLLACYALWIRKKGEQRNSGSSSCAVAGEGAGGGVAVTAAEAAILSPDIMTLILSPLRGISAQELAFKTPPGKPIIFWPEQGTSVSACSCSRKASTGSAVSSLMLNEEPFQVITTGITGIVADSSLSQTAR